ncbi:MAG TPA: DedA family protein [Sneathiellales bacterium]|nr:DedA family protein [Sneathiellales bacterium]
MGSFIAFGGLFISAFSAATLLPGSSEALLTALLLAREHHPWALLAVATVGNVLGAVVNWGCGRFLAAFQDRWWFPVSSKRYAQAIGWFERFGLWSLLFAWAPLIGDPLTVIAGTLRTRILPFILLVTIGKFARYLVVFMAASAWKS